MTNSEVEGPKPTIENVEQDDFDEFAETAVLENLDELDDPESVLDKTAIMEDSVAVTDNVGDVSVEINVEELIANIEANEDKDVARKKEIRRRLEEVVEDRAFEDTYAIDVDEKSD